jgi:DNA-binding IclR family transcriptional regulator
MSVAVAEKIFLLLETLAQSDHALPLKQLAQSTGLPKPTTHRLLQTLQGRGYVTREGKSNHYLLGHRIQELARGPMQQQVKNAALPLMQKLHKTINETVNLGVREGSLVRYVDYLETTRSLRFFVRPGQTDPLFSTALGRAILSALSPDEVRDILAATSREDLASTIRPAKLTAMIADSRQRGWSEEHDETVQGVSCLGISLKRLGYPHAAVSVSIPTVRCTDACRKTIETIFKRFNHRGI